MASKRETDNKEQLKNAHDEYIKSREAEIKAIKKRQEDELAYVNTCLVQYSNQKDRNRLLKNGRKFCYSKEKLKQIEQHFTAWNMDSVDINVVEDVYELKIFVEDKTIKGFLEKFYNIFHDDEGEKTNGIWNYCRW